jgi:hypothetical protein
MTIAPAVDHELFDTTEYRVTPQIDGKDVTRSRLRFTGSIEVSHSDPELVGWYDTLNYGDVVTLQNVTLRVAGKNGSFRGDADSEGVERTVTLQLEAFENQ